MKTIAVERARIEGYTLTVNDAQFFNDRNYHEDLEWLLLAYLTDILTAVGSPSPQYAEKLHPPNPDFQTYLASGAPFRRVEVTEILRPDYRRGDFYRECARSGQNAHMQPDPHSHPWSSVHRVLRSKLKKPYAEDSWLLIYHDMSAFEFEEFRPWHERVLCELRAWTTNTHITCDITESRYESIFVIDASGKGAVRLHPHWDVVRPSPFPR